ncbi:MAG: ABC transporter substrate-binding protein [Desulfohalobiaceae bacterium]|nr:ABC transporter substrate-binding protein [Desulfohalobiaceae bacterium]
MLKFSMKTIAFCICGTALLLAGSIAPAQAKSVKIGALIPMTGDLQAYGESCYTGIQLAVEQINEQGGVLGSKLELKLGDTQTKPQPGIDAAQKLVSVENVSAIVGALSSGVTIPVASSVTSSAGVVLMSPASTSPVITNLDDNDFLFRSVPSDAFQGVALAQLVEEAGYENVATLYVNNDYGEGLAVSFEEAFEKKGGTVSQSLAYEPGNASYRGELSKAASKGAEALNLIGYPENGITILRQALEEGLFTKFIFSDGLKAPELIEAIGAEYLNGSSGTVPQALSDTPSAQNYLTAYKERFGQVPPKPYIDTSYDATFVLSLAIEKAGSSDSKAVKEVLRDVANPPGEKVLPGEWAKAVKLLSEGKDVDYVGASGSVDFDENGDVGGTFGHWMIKDGEIVTVKVFEPTM